MISELGLNRADIIIGIFVGLFCIIGFINGAIAQFFSILAFLFASIISVVAPYVIKLPFIEEAQPAWGYIILAVLVWLPSYLILNSIGKFIARRMLKGGIKLGDHIWGLFFGGIKGSIIIIILIFLISSFPPGVKQLTPAVSREFDESKIVSFVKPYNPFFKLHIMQNLNLIINAINDPDYAELLLNDPNFQKLIEQKSIKEVLDDPELENSLKKQQYFKFITNQKIQQLIKDPKALKLLMTTDIDKAVIDNI